MAWESFWNLYIFQRTTRGKLLGQSLCRAFVINLNLYYSLICSTITRMN